MIDSEVVIIGAGFGGLEAAKVLGKAGVQTTVIDRHNHHLFQPLLYQVATAALSATDVAEPIRKILRHENSVQVIFGEVAEVDAGASKLWMTCGQGVTFRYLIVATGAEPSYFGNEGWAQWAPGIKTIDHARYIRSQLLLAFERAERARDNAQQDLYLRVTIIGGGPTGVELAGSIAELSRFTLARDFRRINPASMRVVLVEAAPGLLSGFSEDCSNYAKKRLEKLGVRIRTGSTVEAIEPNSITINGQTEPAGLVIWAAGVSASPLAAGLGETDRAGRIKVDSTLAVQGQERVFAVGDVALFLDEDGIPLPGLAQVAKQQGAHLGNSLVAHLRRQDPLKPFRYNNRGNTAIIGRHAAVFERGKFRTKGWFAWLAWAVIHVYLLAGFQHRFLVAAQWLWRYLTYERGARLIGGDFKDTDDQLAAPALHKKSRSCTIDNTDVQPGSAHPE